MQCSLETFEAIHIHDMQLLNKICCWSAGFRYCECFLAKVYCSGCQCLDCMNTVRAHLSLFTCTHSDHFLETPLA